MLRDMDERGGIRELRSYSSHPHWLAQSPIHDLGVPIR
jgi:hypothetical protein